jgi:hypothetical protein
LASEIKLAEAFIAVVEAEIYFLYAKGIVERHRETSHEHQGRNVILFFGHGLGQSVINEVSCQPFFSFSIGCSDVEEHYPPDWTAPLAVSKIMAVHC